MNNYLYKILKEGDDRDYTQEQYEKSERDIRKIKLMI